MLPAKKTLLKDGAGFVALLAREYSPPKVAFAALTWTNARPKLHPIRRRCMCRGESVADALALWNGLFQRDRLCVAIAGAADGRYDRSRGVEKIAERKQPGDIDCGSSVRL